MRILFPLLLGIVLCVPSAWAAEPKVGMIVSDAKAGTLGYEKVERGLFDVLEKNGIHRSAVIVKDAEGDKAKASKAARELLDQGVDVLVTLGTMATTAAMRETKEKPIVFSDVYDPISAGIAAGWRSSGNNTTGASNFVEISKVLDRLAGILSIKSAEVLYTPGQKNSELQLAAARLVEKFSSMKVEPVAITSMRDVASLDARWAAKKPDLIFITGSSIVGEHISQVLAAARHRKILTASHLEEAVRDGATLGLIVDHENVGRISGEALVKVLKGSKPADVPIEFPTPDFVLNLKAARADDFDIPDSLRRWATKTIE